jgi:hypothetical protein
MKYLTLAACTVVVALLLMSSFNASAVAGQVLSRARRGVDWAKFSHRTHTEKEKLACASCHKFPTANWKEVRKGDEAFPDVAEFPEHGSCLNCHRKQFFARQRPAPAICANCHVNVTPRHTERLVFPSLGAAPDFVSEFTVFFPKDKHEDADCAECPKTSTHAKCFSCHNQESELAPLPPDCDTCHKPQRNTKGTT